MTPIQFHQGLAYWFLLSFPSQSEPLSQTFYFFGLHAARIAVCVECLRLRQEGKWKLVCQPLAKLDVVAVLAYYEPQLPILVSPVCESHRDTVFFFHSTKMSGNCCVPKHMHVDESSAVSLSFI